VPVKLILQASNLSNKTSFFALKKPSPFAVVTLLPPIGSNKEATVIGQTEPIPNTIHPQWIQYFTLEYEFGKDTFLDITIYNDTTKKPIGSGKIEVGRILGKRHNSTASRLTPSGTLFAQIVPFELPRVARSVHFAFEGGVRSKLKYYYEVHRRDFFSSSALWTPVYRSEPKRMNDTLGWEKCSIPLYDIATNELRATSVDGDATDCPIRIMFWEHRKINRHQVLGSFETTVAGLVLACKHERELKLNEGSKEYVKVASLNFSGNNEDNSGEEDLGSDLPPPIAAPTPQDLPPKPTFVDYCVGGCELDLSVAIDFTSSNGSPTIPGSPHYIDPQSLNQYQKAIIAIGSIVTKYDSDQRSQVWGFGAKYGGCVRHVFQAGDESHVTGVKGILEAYRQTFTRGLVMSGPVVFTNVIKYAAKKARMKLAKAQAEQQLSYSILLILTHGSVSDVEATKNVLKEVSDSPLSIVIIGIGDNDFSRMKFLDDFQNEEGGRDICNFVKFEADKDRNVLTEEALNEVPTQLTSYFMSRNMLPSQPEPKEEEIEVEDFIAYPECTVAHTFDPTGGLHLSERGHSAPVTQQYNW